MEKNKLPYKKDVFRLPDQYFDTLEERIMDKVASYENCIPETTVKSAFKVPDGYFETFEQELLPKLEQKKTSPKVLSLLNRESFYYVAGIAAVFIALISTVSLEEPQPVPTGSNIGDIEMLALEKYIFETMEVSSFDLSEWWQESETTPEALSQSNIEYEAIVQYLNENVEKSSIIYNEN